MEIIVAYLLLAVLFARIIWGIWDVRDLTPGDTSSYYLNALGFAQHLTCEIAWSPLYTSYFGAWHWINPDPYFVVIAHRIGILALLTVLIFEVSRRLLPLFMGWLVTAWWLILPIDHNALYEVHLFALIPVCVFWLLLSISQTPTMRGICVGLLVIGTVLVRNELLITLGIFGFCSMAFDLYQIWKKRTALPLWRYLVAYGLPLFFAVLMIALSYQRSIHKYPGLSHVLEVKHTLNVAQIYAFGYGQRHPEYQDSPWDRYQPLMKRDFGEELPSMRKAFQANPKAMMEHFLWNASLIPSGLQVALFNCRAGSVDPDYVRSQRNPPVAWTLSALYLAVVAGGLVLVCRHFRRWYEGWLRDRLWVILGILAVCATVAVVMIMQRPRPSYMFAQTVAMMLLGGFSLQVILHHLRLDALVRRFAILPILAVTFLAPRGFAVAATDKPSRKLLREGKSRQQLQTRPLLMELELLRPHREDLGKGEGVVAVSRYASELNSYLGGIYPEGLFFDTSVAFPDATAKGSFADELRRRNARIVVITYHQMKIPSVVDFMDHADALGWKLERTIVDLGREYRIYVSNPAPAAP